MVCLGIRPLPGLLLHPLGRETFLAPVEWDEEGWPVVNGGATLEFAMEAPLPAREPDGADPLPEWRSVRGMPDAVWNGGELCLGAGAPIASDDGVPGLLVTPQREFFTVFSARVETPRAEGARCGVTAFVSGDYQYALALVQRAGGCHHGMIYYDSKRDPERVHPGLGGKDLLRMQLGACRAAGIRTPVYTSVQWDAYSAKTHPEWVSRDAEGRAVGEGFGKVQRPFEAGFYSTMCLNTPYRDFLRGHIEEILDTFDPVDGLFLDIVNPSTAPARRALKKCAGWGSTPPPAQCDIDAVTRMPPLSFFAVPVERRI